MCAQASNEAMEIDASLDYSRAEVAADARRPPEADGAPPRMPFNTADAVR
jgi:hypothetical protein